MKKILLVIGCWLLVIGSYSQAVSQRLQNVYQQFETDTQLKHAISSLYVIDAKTGAVVFNKNAQVGLAPASTQKIITSVTAFELLGKDYRYKTEFWWIKFPQNKSQKELVIINPSGDPTFGSSRYTNSKPDFIFKKLSDAIRINGLAKSRLTFEFFGAKFESQKIPDGWIWQDIGNYYGTGVHPINWKENQSDIVLLASPIINDFVTVKSVDSLAGTGYINNRLRTGAKNSGDNAYYYFLYGNHIFSYPLLKGTIPAGEKNFKISVAVAHPFNYFINELKKYDQTPNDYSLTRVDDGLNAWTRNTIDKLIYTHYSPSLDSIIYWFNKRSINLYGEALVKTFAYEKQGFGSTDSGVAIVKRFWKEKGLDEDELNIYDGSGLSPLNRVTTHAQVEILKYAKSRDWYPYFYDALPEYNAMKMKSGTISDVKGFCGYHQSKEAKEYIFSFLVNNYSGKSADLVSKMYKVLNELK